MHQILSAWIDFLRKAGACFAMEPQPVHRPDVWGTRAQSVELQDFDRNCTLTEESMPEAALNFDHASQDIALLLREEGQKLAGKRLLDLGCGTGMLAIIAAKLGAIVSASDVDPRAIELSNHNAKRQGLSLDLRLGDLGKPFAGMTSRGEYFDWIIANLPHKPGTHESGLPLAQAGGKEGVDVWERALVDILALTHRGSRLAFFMHSLPHPRLVAAISESFQLRMVSWKLRYFEKAEYSVLREAFRCRHEAGLSFLFQDEAGEGMVACTWIGIRK